MRAFYRVAAALAVAVVLFLGPVGSALAQSGSATITGTVTADSGAGLGGAAVIFDGPSKASTTTDSSGNFSVSVQPGQYTITVNKGGYQSGSTDVVGLDGQSTTVAVTLTESSLSNLQVIGRTATNVAGNTAKFNISSSESVSLSPALIQERDVPDLPKILSSMPGLVVSTNSSTNNSFIRVHGLGQETMVTIDGHPISSGVSGTFLGQFTDTGLLGGIDVLTGAGIYGSNSGESAVGTVNIRTPDFSSKDSLYAQGGLDTSGGSFETFLATLNAGKFSFVLGKSFSGYITAANQDVYGLVSGNVGSGAGAVNGGAKPAPNFQYTPPYLTNNLLAYQQPLTGPIDNNAQLAKMRFKFSDATSIAFEFFGTQATLAPVGANFGQFDGYLTVPQCLTGGKAASGAGCVLNSAYNSPFATNVVGTTVPTYTFFPNENITNSNPNFNLDFKTTLGNDTILLRPYTANITRLTNASTANSVYGNGNSQVAQASFQVVNPANCQLQFIAPTAAAGAKGPCYMPGSNPNGPAYVVATGGASAAFPVTTNPAGFTCSVATPCYTTTTQQSNSGVWGFGTPSYAEEFDQLGGYTFSYIHPVGNNIYNFSIDHYYNDTVSYSGDLSPLAPGCVFTQAGGSPAGLAAGDPALQPGCTLIGPNGTNAINYKATPLAIPNTFASVTSFALTAQLQVTRKLEFDWGNYFTHYAILGQQESPAFLSTFVAAQVAAGDAPNIGLAPIVLSGFVNSASHYDPHFGFVWRPTGNVAIRATGGSSIEVPYASIVSGLESVSGGGGSAVTEFNIPNPNLLPEIVVAEDLGGDYRFKNGAVFSLDLFNDFVHQTWLQTQFPIPTPSGYPAGGSYIELLNTNGSGRWSRGAELTFASLPQTGFGYSLAFTVNRLNYVNLPVSFENLGTYTPDGAQDYGYPYDHGYLDLQYGWGAYGSLARVGADYEGTGNPLNDTAYTQLDAGLKIGFPHGWALQGGIENLTNITNYALYAHALGFQGTVPVNQTINPNGTITYNNGPARGVSAPFPLTIRFSLIKQL